jgi:hypothetical protein
MKTEIKFVPVAPKTYEVRYVENKEPGKLFKLASYLGMKTVYNCNEKDCKCLIKSVDDAAKIVKAATDSANEAAGKYGGTTDTTVDNKTGNVTVTYDSSGKKK